MQWHYVLPIILGLLAVLQAGINERVLKTLGLSATVLLNSTLVIATCVSVALIARYALGYQLPLLRSTQTQPHWSWLYILPGVCGYCLVAGIPLSVSWIGASRTFVVIIVFQTLGSLGWDFWILKKAVTTLQTFGALLACTGAILVTIKPTSA